jgi:hypothetical protein
MDQSPILDAARIRQSPAHGHSSPVVLSRTLASRIACFLTIAALVGTVARFARATSLEHGSGSFNWNLSDPNWSTGLWNNANGDGALFDATGAGAINVTAPINVDSLNVFASGYIFNGTGPLTFVDGSSALTNVTSTPTRIKVDTHFDLTINAPINSSFGLIKKAPGTLVLAGPITFSGLGYPLTSATNILPVDIYAAGISGQFPSDYSGITRIMNTSVLPTTTRLGVSMACMILAH